MFKSANQRDPARLHLPWLAAASGQGEAKTALEALARKRDPELRVQAIRALAEFRQLKPESELFERALADKSAAVQHACGLVPETLWYHSAMSMREVMAGLGPALSIARTPACGWASPRPHLTLWGVSGG